MTASRPSVLADGASRQRPSPAVRAAAIVDVVLGVGFGSTALIAIDHLARTGELPMTPFGFRALEGPFVRQADDAVIALAWSLAGVCGAQILAGIWLWQGRRRGAWLGLAATPPALVLGAGFALPFLLIGAPASAALSWIGRRDLR